MKLFSKSKKHGKNTITERDQILGYFDEVVRQRQNLKVNIKNRSWSCTLYDIEDKKNLLRIQERDFLLYEHENCECGFSLDDTWFVFESTLVYMEDRPHLLLPDAIYHQERRRHSRIGFSSRENIQVSVLEKIGKGIGFRGTLENISLGGGCIQIERAMDMISERDITPQPDLLKTGTQLMLVRIDRIPGLPSFDTSGVFQEIRRGMKWSLAFVFDNLDAKLKNVLSQAIESRSMPFKLTRRSRKKRLEMDRRRQEDESAEKVEPASADSEAGEEKKTSPAKPEAGRERVESPKPDSARQRILVIGDTLKKELGFLGNHYQFEPFWADTVEAVLDYLRHQLPNFIFIQCHAQEHKMLDFLLKLSEKNIFKDVGFYLFIEELITEEDIVKCRRLGIKHIIKLPMESPAVLLERLTQDQPKPSP